MQQVEVIYRLSAKDTYNFEGEEKIQSIKFNRPETLKLYQLVVSKQSDPNEIQKRVWELYPDLSDLIKSEQRASSVCAKIVGRGETIVQCYDCRMDQSCIICLDCFKKSNHTGHKVLFKKAYGGCCDCGDSEAWNPKGFCSLHSGEAQEVNIQPQQIQQFKLIFQDIFYIYYRLKLVRLNQKVQNVCFSIIKLLIDKIIEESGVRGIKLISLFLNGTIPDNLKFNKLLQNLSILQHLLTWRFMHRKIKVWEDIFIKMFPYYQFKKRLLFTYIQSFPLLYVDQQSCMTGQSISCQILTSYKLVEDYIDSPYSKPICYNLDLVNDLEHMNWVSGMLFSDLQKIFNLQSPVPEKYMRFVVEKKGVANVFAYYGLINQQITSEKQKIQEINSNLNRDNYKKKLKKKAKKRQKALDQNFSEPSFFNPIFFMIQNIKQVYNEHSSLSIFLIMVRSIKHDKELLFKILEQCVELMVGEHDEIVIFRVLDRAFCLTLFTICDQDLQNLENNEFRSKILNLVGKNEDEAQKWINSAQERMLETYFFYAHIICNQNRGYHSSFFNYIYLYRNKDHLLASIDTIYIKMISLLSKASPIFNLAKILRFKDFDQEKWSIYILSTFYQELQLLYITKFSEIYISHYDASQGIVNKELKNEAVLYLAKFIVGQGNTTTLDKAAKFCKSFLFNNNETLKQYLMECCNFIKDRKIFELKQQFRIEKPFNFKNFELKSKDEKISNKNIEQQMPQLTANLINGYNKKIYGYFWNYNATEQFKDIIINLFNDLSTQKVNENLTELAQVMYRLCYTSKYLGFKQHQILIQQMLLRVQIPSEIKQKLPHFKDIFGVQQQKSEQSKILQKRQLLRQKKLKKMEDIKKNIQNNVNVILETHHIKQQEQIQEDYCTICKNQQSKKHQLVYLVNLSIRNLQKLAKLGSGVQTISLKSCYHIFDFECLKKQSKDNQINIKCPICRGQGNLYVPAYPLADQQQSSIYVKYFIERIIQVMMTIYDFQQINPIEQIFKSFYHYSLLSQFDVEHVKKNRLKIYKLMVQILSHKINKDSLYEFIAKFSKNQVNLNPKIIRKSAIQVIDLRYNAFMQNSQQSQEDEENSIMLISRLGKKMKLSDDKGSEIQMSPVLRYTCTRIMKYILDKAVKNNQIQAEKANQKEQQIINLKRIQETLNNIICPQPSIQLNVLIDQLLDTPNQNQYLPYNSLKLQLLKLPLYFDWDMTNNKCNFCNSQSHDMFVCLLCIWGGCLNCKSGGVNKHLSEKHGQSSAFMRLNDGTAYVFTTKSLKKVGCLYVNQWGEQLRLKNDWKQYHLQEQILEKVQSYLIKDQ